MNNINLKNAFPLICSRENINLAYRNIKSNTGSNTKGIDGKTIKDYENLTEQEIIDIVRNGLENYKPDPIRRIYIDKPNGDKRPLGIPTFKDRLIQQCILQIIEPHCEAKFHNRSHGFRPFRSPETALAQSYLILNKQNLHYAVSIDIQGFFDNVNHKRLINQIWNIGIRDKKLLKIIKLMLKTNIVDNGITSKSNKGTPQGAILSPILSNIVLNDLDQWLSSQWETYNMNQDTYTSVLNSNGSLSQSSKYRGLRRKTKMKEFFFTRYADDFIIFTNTKENANKLKFATIDWIEKRLNLNVNIDKTKVVNLKKSSIEFLGIQMKVIKKSNKYVVKSRIPKNKQKNIHNKLKKQIKRIQHSTDLRKEINKYNSIVMGIQNYYNKATMVSHDLALIQYNIHGTFKNRIKEYSNKGSIENNKLIKSKYGKTKQMRYIGTLYILPIGYVKHKNPMHKPYKLKKFTKEGRKILQESKYINYEMLNRLNNQRLDNYSIEYKDNRISKFINQNGKCFITKKLLYIDEIHCHHIKPKHLGGNDKYNNLVIINKELHKCIHTTKRYKYERYISEFNLNNEQIQIINDLRRKAKSKFTK